MDLSVRVALGVVLTSTLTALPSAQELEGRTLTEWQRLIEPASEELAWAEIPWHASLSDAVEEARARERPILLWAVNGHPLGCV